MLYIRILCLTVALFITVIPQNAFAKEQENTAEIQKIINEIVTDYYKHPADISQKEWLQQEVIKYLPDKHNIEGYVDNIVKESTYAEKSVEMTVGSENKNASNISKIKYFFSDLFINKLCLDSAKKELVARYISIRNGIDEKVKTANSTTISNLKYVNRSALNVLTTVFADKERTRKIINNINLEQEDYDLVINNVVFGCATTIFDNLSQGEINTDNIITNTLGGGIEGGAISAATLAIKICEEKGLIELPDDYHYAALLGCTLVKTIYDVSQDDITLLEGLKQLYIRIPKALHSSYAFMGVLNLTYSAVLPITGIVFTPFFGSIFAGIIAFSLAAGIYISSAFGFDIMLSSLTLFISIMLAIFAGVFSAIFTIFFMIIRFIVIAKNKFFRIKTLKTALWTIFLWIPVSIISFITVGLLSFYNIKL